MNILWLGIPIGLAMAAFFSGAEIGMLSINRIRVRHLAETGVPWAIACHRILTKEIHRFVAAMLIAVNLGIITASCLVTSIFGKSLLITEIGLSLFILLFCEIIPKTVFRRFSSHLIHLFFWQINLAYRIIFPFTYLVSFLKPMREKITRGEIELLVKEAEKEGVLSETEEDMVVNVLGLSKRRVSEIMTTRTEMITVSCETNLEKVIETVERSGFSRLPIYDEGLDDIIGILHTKDILNFWEKEKELPAIEFMKLAHFIPEQAKIDDCLADFRRNRVHIGIVVDEYGGTSGLVTLEDLLEEIVGEIEDEFDVEDILVQNPSDGLYLIDGFADIDLLSEEFGIELPKGEWTTISGFILDRLGRIPKEGEKIETENLCLTIEKCDKKRIYKVRCSEIKGQEKQKR
ncbi:MAG: hemolysin family protein [bacterium]|nr:hemolysin family protein [bacterium]